MEERSIEIAETVPASRKLGEDRARDLIRDAKTVSVAKGKKLDVFERGSAADEIVPKMLGSTGNLRAPIIVVGDRVVVGFNEDVYREVFGG
jgi:arsenate reductase-like glutaredoxin family protein